MIIKAIVWAIIGAILYPIVSWLFIRGTHETNLKTENGEYKVYIERMRTFSSPYMQVQITDQTRKKMYSKRVKDPEFVQAFDSGKKDEVVFELVKWFEKKFNV